jgi:hypothetical protein
LVRHPPLLPPILSTLLLSPICGICCGVGHCCDRGRSRSLSVPPRSQPAVPPPPALCVQHCHYATAAPADPVDLISFFPSISTQYYFGLTGQI